MNQSQKIEDDENAAMDRLADACKSAFRSLTSWKMFGRKIKFFWQRLFRGWDDSETWSLDHTITLFVLPKLTAFVALERLRLHQTSGRQLSLWPWENELMKMESAFQLLKSEFDVEYTEEEVDIIKDGLSLFADYYQDLTIPYDDILNKEVKDLNTTITSFVLPRLKRFKELNNGFPGMDFTEESWDAELDKMILAFNLLNIRSCYNLSAKDLDNIKKGLRSFATYYGHLWW